MCLARCSKAESHCADMCNTHPGLPAQAARGCAFAACRLKLSGSCLMTLMLEPASCYTQISSGTRHRSPACTVWLSATGRPARCWISMPESLHVHWVFQPASIALQGAGRPSRWPAGASHWCCCPTCWVVLETQPHFRQRGMHSIEQLCCAMQERCALPEGPACRAPAAAAKHQAEGCTGKQSCSS